MYWLWQKKVGARMAVIGARRGKKCVLQMQSERMRPFRNRGYNVVSPVPSTAGIRYPDSLPPTLVDPGRVEGQEDDVFPTAVVILSEYS